jgi:hypothetical protein
MYICQPAVFVYFRTQRKYINVDQQLSKVFFPNHQKSDKDALKSIVAKR